MVYAPYIYRARCFITAVNAAVNKMQISNNVGCAHSKEGGSKTLQLSQLIVNHVRQSTMVKLLWSVSIELRFWLVKLKRVRVSLFMQLTPAVTPVVQPIVKQILSGSHPAPSNHKASTE